MNEVRPPGLFPLFVFSKAWKVRYGVNEWRGDDGCYVVKLIRAEDRNGGEHFANFAYIVTRCHECQECHVESWAKLWIHDTNLDSFWKVVFQKTAFQGRHGLNFPVYLFVDFVLKYCRMSCWMLLINPINICKPHISYSRDYICAHPGSIYSHWCRSLCETSVLDPELPDRTWWPHRWWSRVVVSCRG